MHAVYKEAEPSESSVALAFVPEGGADGPGGDGP